MESYSQYGQDIFIFENFFVNKKEGFYVDIGAYDGIKLSNTYLLYKLGWLGACFEPNKSIFPLLEKNRLNDQNYNFPIGPENKSVQYLNIEGQPDMLSGVMDYYHLDHLSRINREMMETDSNADSYITEMLTLNSVLPSETEIDYLSIDTEGGEPLILKNILNNFSPKIISIEINYQEDFDKLKEFIFDKYLLIKQLGCDLIFKLK